MYKRQMLFQKILCLLTLISGGLIFIYSLGIMTDLYDSLYTALNPVKGKDLYYEMQDFNKLFVKLSIGFILVTALLFFTNTNMRRKYYIGNYVAIGLNVVYGLAFTVWAHLQIQSYRKAFLNIDFDALKENAMEWHPNDWQTYYTDSTFWFDMHYLVFGILLVLEVLHIYNFLWKKKLMEEETGLIGKGKEAVS